jgi:hypothetical protein
VINRHYTQANLELMKSYLDRIDLGLVVEFDQRYRFPVIRGCALLAEESLRVSLALDANDQPKAIEVHEPQSGATHVILPERVVNPKDRASIAENLDRMGCRLASLLAGRRYRIEGMVDQTVHRVLGVLLAVALARTAGGARPGADCVSPEAAPSAAGSPRIQPAALTSRPRLQAAIERLPTLGGSARAVGVRQQCGQRELNLSS